MPIVKFRVPKNRVGNKILDVTGSKDCGKLIDEYAEVAGVSLDETTRMETGSGCSEELTEETEESQDIEE